MIVSILSRYTAAPDAEWRTRAARLLARLRPFLERQDGFVSIELLRSEDGGLAEITRWQSAAACRRYVRDGGAATAAAFADALFPTAAYPRGAWVRRTFEVVEA